MAAVVRDGRRRQKLDQKRVVREKRVTEFRARWQSPVRVTTIDQKTPDHVRFEGKKPSELHGLPRCFVKCCQTQPVINHSHSEDCCSGYQIVCFSS